MNTEQTRYWCHVCNKEVSIYMAPEPTCQECNEQFIEELHSDDDPREFLAGNELQNDGNNNTETDSSQRQSGATQFFSFGPRPNDTGELGDEVFQFFAPRSTNGNDENRTPNDGPSPLANMLQNMLTNIIGDNMEARGETNQPMLFYGDYVNGNFRFRSANSQRQNANDSNNTTNDGHSADNTSTHENDDNNNDANTNENEGPTGEAGGARLNGINSILQYLAAITGGTFDGGMVGNPNDYVFSQTALDNIITQLMEQTSGASAPAPAPDQVIESLKKRGLTEEEKKQETDCAVCKDAFTPEEMVIELPCEHIFHDDCIKPWLKLNGTCPVCRHSVLPEKTESEETTDENGNTTSNSETNNQSSNTSHPTTATFTFVNGQPVHGSSTMPASWPESITSLFQSTDNNQAQRSSSSNAQEQPSSQSSHHDDSQTSRNHSDSQQQSDDSEQASSHTASQQKPSSDKNNDLDDDQLYMDLD